jgi:hypothetical protein
MTGKYPINKSTRQSKPRLQITKTRDNILRSLVFLRRDIYLIHTFI